MGDNSDSSDSDPPKEAPFSPGSSVSSQFQNDYEDFVTMAVTALSQTRQQLADDDGTMDNTEDHQAAEKMIDVDIVAEDIADKIHISHIAMEKTPLEMHLQIEETFGNQEELHRLENIVDGWSFDLKRSILAEYNQTRCKLQTHVKKIIEEEKTRLHDSVESLRNQIISLQELCSSYQEALDRKTKMVDNMSIDLAKQRDKVALAQKFADWRQKKEEKKREDFCQALATRFYKQNVLRKTLGRWKVAVETNWTTRFEKRNQHKAQEVCRQLAANYEQKMKQLNFELSAAREETQKVRNDYTNLEDHMRKAVLRGVSALNMETMTAFGNQSAVTDGLNSGAGDLSQRLERIGDVANSREDFPHNVVSSTELQQGNYSFSRQEEADDVPREPKLLLSSEIRQGANHYSSDLISGFESSFKSNGYTGNNEWPSNQSKVTMVNGDRGSPYSEEKFNRSFDRHEFSTFKDTANDVPQYQTNLLLHNETNGSPNSKSLLTHTSAPNHQFTVGTVLSESTASPYSKPLVTHSGPSRTVSARDDARRLLSSRAGSTTTASPSQRTTRSGYSSMSARDRAPQSSAVHPTSGVLTVQANSPAGSAYHSSSAIAGVLVEKHQAVNKHTIGPLITNHRSESFSNMTQLDNCRRTLGQPITNQ